MTTTTTRSSHQWGHRLDGPATPGIVADDYVVLEGAPGRGVAVHECFDRVDMERETFQWLVRWEDGRETYQWDCDLLVDLDRPRPWER